jgi:hypothetical protein
MPARLIGTDRVDVNRRSPPPWLPIIGLVAFIAVGVWLLATWYLADGLRDLLPTRDREILLGLTLAAAFTASTGFLTLRDPRSPFPQQVAAAQIALLVTMTLLAPWGGHRPGGVASIHTYVRVPALVDTLWLSYPAQVALFLLLRAATGGRRRRWNRVRPGSGRLREQIRFRYQHQLLWWALLPAILVGGPVLVGASR